MADTDNKTSYRVGIDIGGTFTDIVFVASNGRVITKKVPSTPEDYSLGILNGLTEILTSDQIAPDFIGEVVHGTTIATNAILEGTGAKTALVTTAGFRDVLEIRRIRMPQLYNVQWDKPEPLVPRALRLEVNERVDARGDILQALDEDQLAEVIARLRRSDVEAVAVCLLNSYINPAHEARVGELLRASLPGVSVSLSSDIIQELKEYERTSTTVIDAYVKPVVDRYLSALQQRLDDARIRSRLLIMQSNGSVMSAGAARQQPCYIIESGPAAGVVGGLAMSSQAGYPNIITFDMGGTTAKAAMIEDGQAALTEEYEVSAGITVGNRLMKGDGYLLRIPAIDLAEVGAGGGSIAWIDSGGYPQVGPRSAGAVPGPACYGLGNTEPTITDANVVLGYIHPDRFAGGSLSIDPDLSYRALESFGKRLDLTPLAAAHAIHVIGNARMSRAIQSVSTERGRDVRDYALLAFGGNGPIHAAALAVGLGMTQVLIPARAGLFSAVGLIFSDIGHQFVRTQRLQLNAEAGPDLLHALSSMREDAIQHLIDLGYPVDMPRIDFSADLRYVGQSFSLMIGLPEAEEPNPSALVTELIERFGREHLRTYGHHAIEEPVELVNLRATATITGAGSDASGSAAYRASVGSSGRGEQRMVTFDRDQGPVAARVVARDDLREESQGPLLVEEDDTTVVVPPGSRARLDDWGNILIDVGEGS